MNWISSNVLKNLVSIQVIKWTLDPIFGKNLTLFFNCILVSSNVAQKDDAKNLTFSIIKLCKKGVLGL